MVIDNAGLVVTTLNKYEGHYHSIDPFMEAARAVPTGGCLRDYPAFGLDTIRRSPFYNDFLYRHDISSLMLTQALREPDIEWTITFQHSTRRSHFNNKHEHALGRLVSHLQRALQLRLRLRELERRANLGEAALDAFGTPLLFVGPSGRLLLCWPQPSAASARPWPKACGCPTVPTSWPCRCPPAYRSRDEQDQERALVLVHTHLKPASPTQGMLKSLFGLSAAEYRLLEVLMMGATLSRAAEQLGLSVEPCARKVRPA